METKKITLSRILHKGKACLLLKSPDVKLFRKRMKEQFGVSYSFVQQGWIFPATDEMLAVLEQLVQADLTAESRDMDKHKQAEFCINGEEAEAIISCSENSKHRAILRLIYESGLRCSELLNLRVRDFSRESGSLKVQLHTTGKNKLIPLSEQAQAALLIYLEEHQPVHWLFEGNSVGIRPKNQGNTFTEPFSERGLQSVFSRALKQSGLKRTISLNKFRKLCQCAEKV